MFSWVQTVPRGIPLRGTQPIGTSSHRAARRPCGRGANPARSYLLSAALKGFITPDHQDARAGGHHRHGARAGSAKSHIKWRETVVAGLERAPEAFLGLFRGDSLGKIPVDLRWGPGR
jgi:NADPH-dependent curcumin reductase CurA